MGHRRLPATRRLGDGLSPTELNVTGWLTDAQLELLRCHGEERTAEVGDVRSGSVKRCATAVGDGAMVVRFVHERMPAGHALKRDPGHWVRWPLCDGSAGHRQSARARLAA